MLFNEIRGHENYAGQWNSIWIFFYLPYLNTLKLELKI